MNRLSVVSNGDTAERWDRMVSDQRVGGTGGEGPEYSGGRRIITPGEFHPSPGKSMAGGGKVGGSGGRRIITPVEFHPSPGTSRAGGGEVEYSGGRRVISPGKVDPSPGRSMTGSRASLISHRPSDPGFMNVGQWITIKPS